MKKIKKYYTSIKDRIVNSDKGLMALSLVAAIGAWYLGQNTNYPTNTPPHDQQYILVDSIGQEYLCIPKDQVENNQTKNKDNEINLENNTTIEDLIE